MFFVDDEPWVLKSLIHFIDWPSYGFSVHASFTDPYDALDAVKADPPDVIFADIRMPGMTGLELAQHCAACGVDSIFIIATAYADFEYAREAIEQQVFSYILKPFEKDVLIGLTQRLQKALQEARLQQIYRLVRSSVLSSLTFGDDPEHTLDLLFNDLLDFVDSDYVIAAVDTRSPSTLKALASALPPITLYGTRHILIFSTPEDAWQAFSGLPPQEFRVGLCRNCSHSLSFCMRASLTALYSVSFFDVAPPILAYSDHACGSADRYGKRLTESIRTQDWSAAEKTLQDLEELSLGAGLLIHQVLRIYQEFVACIREFSPLAGLSDAVYSFQNIFHLCSVFPKASQLYSHMRTLLLSIRGGDNRTAKDSRLREVFCYINDHYSDNITLEFLSTHFHISLSHLCRQFKKTAGMTFTEYLFSFRMDRAMVLLTATDLSITEVSERVGYADYFYFSKMFKKYTGRTPTRYRKDKGLYEVDSQS